jgi:hypothetical protein
MNYIAGENLELVPTGDPDEISIVWSTLHVLCVRPDLTKEQAREVLYELDHSHDATIGINWDVIDIVANNMFEPPENPAD